MPGGLENLPYSENLMKLYFICLLKENVKRHFDHG